MKKSIHDQDFFTRDAKEVALHLLGKYICTKDGEKYLIIETEAYYHTEEFCYGHNIKAEDAKRKNLVCLPLFERSGTWCVYGGQLLLSVNQEETPDNVLIKQLKDKNGRVLNPHSMAQNLNLYKSKPGYCGCHGQFSLCEASGLFLADGGETPEYDSNTRKNLKKDNGNRFRFTIKGEGK